MAIASTHHELEENAGLFRNTIHMKPIAFLKNGNLSRIISDWVQGDLTYPHILRESKLWVNTTDEGMRRFYPTSDINKYLEIGTPYVKVAGVWSKVGFTGSTRTSNKITWSRTQADMSVTFGGHFCKLDIELKNGYVPEDNLIAFPVGISGLTRSGLDILDGSNLVAHLRVPHVYDAADSRVATRPIATQFTTLSGQPYLVMTLPSLTGMTRPVIDPTLTVESSTADEYIAGVEQATYALARSTSTVHDNTYTTNLIGQHFPNPTYSVYRTFLVFDTSAIATGTVTQVNLKLTCVDNDFSVTDFDVNIIKYLRVGTRETDYDAALSNPEDDSIWRNTSGMSLNTEYTSGNLSTAWVNRTGNTGYALVSNLDYDGSGTAPSGAQLIYPASADHATASYRPKLVVEYTLPTVTKTSNANSWVNWKSIDLLAVQDVNHIDLTWI